MYKYIKVFCLLCMALPSMAQNNNVIDEVVWVVGDEAILKSDVESWIKESGWTSDMGNPYCVIPEQIAIQKLFLHQAAVDSLEVGESQINAEVDAKVDDLIQRAGSREKLEDILGSSITQIREEIHDRLRDEQLVKMMRSNLTENVKANPAEVRKQFLGVPEDSLPLIPTQVEVEILVQQPAIPVEEIERIKNQLRDYAERVNKGETTFSALARAYSEDGAARQGGLMPYMSRGDLDPAFAAVAFSLNDPNKVSKVVESEFGFHIIQLVDKRGDKVQCRHILLKPYVDPADIERCSARLDSIAEDIRQAKFSFEEAASVLSDDKDTRNNRGLLTNKRITESERIFTSRFYMDELASYSPELARVVEGLQTGEISKPFQMLNEKGKTVCAVAKLKTRIKQHRASMQEDFQVLRDMVVAKKKEELLLDWIAEKQKNTYIRIKEGWRDCEFQYPGWVR